MAEATPSWAAQEGDVLTGGLACSCQLSVGKPSLGLLHMLF